MATALPTKDMSSGQNNILSVLNAIVPPKTKSTVSGGAETRQTQLTPEAITELINQVLRSNSGLASVVSGQKAAGLYNSSANTMLTNDLINKVTGQAAIASAPTVTTRAPTTTTTSTSSPLGGVGGLAALTVAKKLLDGKGSDIISKGKSIFDSVFGGGGAGGGSGSTSPFLVLSDSGVGSSLGTSSVLGDSGGFLSSVLGSGSSGDILGSGNSFLDFATSSLGSASDSAGFLSDIFGSSGGGFSMPSLPGSGFFIDSLSGNSGDIISGAGKWGGEMALAQIPVIGPPLAFLDSITGGHLVDGVSNFFSDTFGTYICTHLYSTGKMPKRTYFGGYKKFTEYSPESIRGYQYIAAKAVAHMRKHPQSIATRITTALFLARGKNLSGEHNSLLGHIFEAALVSICYPLGFVVPQVAFDNVRHVGA